MLCHAACPSWLTAGAGFLSLFNFYHVNRRLQQQVDELIAGAVGLNGKFVQLCHQFFLHPHRNNLVAVVSPQRGLYLDFDFICHSGTPLPAHYILTVIILIYYNIVCTKQL